MTHVACNTPPQDLLAYWLDELDEEQALRVEEHLFVCPECTARLEGIVRLGAGIRRELLHGGFAGILPEPFVRRLKTTGLRVREYTLEPGGSVNCTITPDDDLVVAYLHAPLQDVKRLDVVIDDSKAGTLRARDVVFDPEAGSLVAVPQASHLRTMSRGQQRVRLVAVDGTDERVIADYTFNHSLS